MELCQIARPGRPMRSGHVIGRGRVVPSSCSHGSWSELTQDDPDHVIDETREWIEPHGFWYRSTRCLEHASVYRIDPDAAAATGLSAGEPLGGRGEVQPVHSRG